MCGRHAEYSHRICGAQLLSPLFFFNDPPTPEIYTLSLHDALPIPHRRSNGCRASAPYAAPPAPPPPSLLHPLRSEEHTSEPPATWPYPVCRLLLEKKKHLLRALLARADRRRGGRRVLRRPR